MFQGSKHVGDDAHFKIIEEAGGDANAGTANDVTIYYETVPSNQLETALWLESDRMGFLLESLTQDKLDKQRGVVKNERRESFDNRPYGAADEIVSAAIFPKAHPYSWSPIGSMADLQAATLGDVKEFFAKYYAPTNATLAVAGDFEPSDAKALIEKYFGPIPGDVNVVRPKIAPVTLRQERRLVLEDPKGTTPQLSITWPVPGLRSPAKPALDALAGILTSDRNSRLTKLLVYDRQLASMVMAFG
jgi:zinc protease